MSETTDWGFLAPFSALAGLLLFVVALDLVRRSRRAARISARLFEGGAARGDSAPEEKRAAFGPATQRISLWLARAGHRSPNAVSTFVTSSLGCVVVAGLLVWMIRASGSTEVLSSLIAGLPVVGPGLGMLASSAPWLVGLVLAGLPIWLVRRDRARRVEEIERDLPLVLELLATLAEAGFGFESAVGELLRVQPPGRPLHDELRLYQLEVSTGARRAESLGRLARRVDLVSVSSFTSALVHGEETGASIAGLLRPQARLVRQRRRERALAAAESLPEKLVVPLLVGFLPGLLVWTLGPAFFQLFEMIDAAFG